MMIPLLTGLCDDAALFPPGNAPLADALPAHARHLASDHSELVGPFVFPAPRLAELGSADIPDVLDLSLTVPGGVAQLAGALDRINADHRVRLAALEIAPEAGQSATEFFHALAQTAPAVDVFVEIPRDDRRRDYLHALADTRFAAKFRTGGVAAGKYPDEAELASALRAAVGAGIAFKATAGLHHAVRNTDSETGFEQHGFLNVLLAVRRALDGADEGALEGVLANRDGQHIANELAALDDEQQSRVRGTFRSFGTCSIDDPLTDLRTLGLIEPQREGTSA